MPQELHQSLHRKYPWQAVTNSITLFGLTKSCDHRLLIVPPTAVKVAQHDHAKADYTKSCVHKISELSLHKMLQFWHFSSSKHSCQSIIPLTGVTVVKIDGIKPKHLTGYKPKEKLFQVNEWSTRSGRRQIQISTVYTIIFKAPYWNDAARKDRGYRNVRWVNPRSLGVI